MSLTLALTAVTAVSAASQSPPSSTQGPGLALSTVRYYRAPSAQTVVDVFCRVPLALVSPFVGNGAGGGGGAFRFAVSVRDSGGLTLVSQSWSEAVTATMLQARGASTGEHLSFAAKAGRYSVEVTFTDSATGRVAHQQAVVRAYASSPAASDLLLGTNIRPLGETDTTVGPGEVRKGSLVIQTSGDPVLTPQAARLGYYLELYPLRTETLTVMLRVLDPVGKQVIAAPAQSLAVAAGGGVTQGLVDLSGLPAGRYQLEVKTAGGGGDSAVTRSAGFGMAGFETVQEAAAAVAASQTQDYFADKTEAQLDTLYAPLVYLMTANEQGVYSSLSLEGKRTWLRQFWAKRDQSPGTSRNEEREAFYGRIAEANRRFREGGASQIPGWRTDRGRIFIRYGDPDEVLDRRQSATTNPYVVWKFTRVRPLKFVFMDLTRFGNYTLIYTDDRREQGRPNWEELLGNEAVDDVLRF